MLKIRTTTWLFLNHSSTKGQTEISKPWNKKKWTETHSNSVGSEENYTEWEKKIPKDYKLYDSIYIKCSWRKKIMEPDRRAVVAKDYVGIGEGYTDVVTKGKHEGPSWWWNNSDSSLWWWLHKLLHVIKLHGHTKIHTYEYTYTGKINVN